jgi:hypothetical protein
VQIHFVASSNESVQGIVFRHGQADLAGLGAARKTETNRRLRFYKLAALVPSVGTLSNLEAIFSWIEGAVSAPHVLSNARNKQHVSENVERVFL